MQHRLQLLSPTTLSHIPNQLPLYKTSTRAQHTSSLAMDRLRSGFHHHRKPRTDSPARPTIITDTTSSGKTTPEHNAHLQQPLQAPGVPSKKSSPFRALRDLSRSHKRARSPAPGSETNSPISAISAVSTSSARDSPIERHTSSPHPLSAVAPEIKASSLHKNDVSPAKQTATLPSFLSLTPQEIDAKFQDIQWMERNRMLQSMHNPSPDFRWARVTGDHLKKLDRYMNIQPWENNRVRLRVPSGKQDYINASPISLTSSSPSVERAQQSTSGSTSAENLAGGGHDRYIAMQGPKQKTTSHVWRMVVEQLESPGVIVMLTETHEGNMEKCWPYFPRTPDDAPVAVNKKDEFGDGFHATVRCEAIEETEAGDAIELRKLVVRVYKGPSKQERQDGAVEEDAPRCAVEFPVDENGDVKMLSPAKADDEEASAAETDGAKASLEVGRTSEDKASTVSSHRSSKDWPPEGEYEERTVWHFLYKKWPDFGVPALEDLDSFFTLMRLSREKNANPSNPRIVHCSAGVGRSGTFIALEHLMREIDAGALENWDSSAAAAGLSRQKESRQSTGARGDVVGDDSDDDAASTEGHNGHLSRGDKKSKQGKADEADHKMDLEEDGGPHESKNDDVGSPAESDDLIFDTVNQLREQRRHMVQAEPQYQFLYQVVQKLWEDRYGRSDNSGGAKNSGQSSRSAGVSSRFATPVSDLPPRLPTPDGEPAAKRLEFDPFVEE